jgi:hypothetical protein
MKGDAAMGCHWQLAGDAALAGLNTRLLFDFPGTDVALPIRTEFLKYEVAVKAGKVLVGSAWPS